MVNFQKSKWNPLSNLSLSLSFYALSLLDIRFKAITKLEMNIIASTAVFKELFITVLTKGLVIE
jgi:hypothetical protein